MQKITFKDLTPENIEYIKHVYYQEMLHIEKMEILSKKFNVAERTIRSWQILIQSFLMGRLLLMVNLGK